MCEKISVMIVDDNMFFRTNLEKYINQQEDMEVTNVAKDGRECIEFLKESSVDIVLLDIIMPHLDGIGVLEKLNDIDLDVKPTIIVISSIGQDSIIREALSLGADYYFVKPIDMKRLINRIRITMNGSVDFTNVNINTNINCNSDINIGINESSMKSDYKGKLNFKNKDNIEVIVTNLLRDLGVPANLSGYNFLREAILISFGESNPIIQVTKILYPQIASKYRVSISKVERSIRNAIELIWEKGNRKLLFNIFGYNYENHIEKPKNSEFISVITDRLKLELKFYN